MSKENSEGKLDSDQLAEVARVFKALADPTRLAILQELKSGSASVSDLTEAAGTSQANVSKHLHLLLDAGLVSRRQQKNHAYYSMEQKTVMPLCELVCSHLNDRNRSKVGLDFAI